MEYESSKNEEFNASSPNYLNSVKFKISIDYISRCKYYVEQNFSVIKIVYSRQQNYLSTVWEPPLRMVQRHAMTILILQGEEGSTLAFSSPTCSRNRAFTVDSKIIRALAIILAIFL